MQFIEWTLFRQLIELPRTAKRLLMVCTDFAIIPLAWALTTALTTNQWLPPLYLESLILVTALTLSAIPIFAKLGLYHAIVRFMSDRAVLAVAQGTTLITAFFLGSIILLNQPELAPYLANVEHVTPEAIIPTLMIFWGVLILMLGGSRLAMRHLIHQHQIHNKKKILIYGAGRTGTELLRTIKSSGAYSVVAFLDDNSTLQKSVIDGVRVEHPDQIDPLLHEHDIRQILLAMPKLTRKERRNIINNLEPFPVQVRTVPALSDVISGQAKITDIQDIDVEDLLGRDPIPPNPALMINCILDKVVLVTGAGGSIGSELCLQIIKQKPKQLLLLDSCEFALYSIERELQALINPNKHGYTRPPESKQVLSLLANVQDKTRIDSIFSTFHIDTVYHAAAFKHVPMVEHNITDGVKNNVFGTLNTAKAAKENGVSTFVLVSTDKAVRPTNVMGTTKRLAELILQGLADNERIKIQEQQAHQKDSRETNHAETDSSTEVNDTPERGTVFCMVRFGNVLGSSGSVVPLFREQINKGGPVTVTHPEVIRYFMTINEAAQLVIQAGAMATGGEVFVLDMGDPVKIDDLAKKMIRLMGKEVRDYYNPRGDVEVHYTGLRPGEKLYEELLIGDHPVATTHPRIMMSKERYLKWEEMEKLISEMSDACQQSRVKRLVELMLNDITGFIPKYRPDDHIERESRSLEEMMAGEEKVAVLRSGT